MSLEVMVMGVGDNSIEKCADWVAEDTDNRIVIVSKNNTQATRQALKDRGVPSRISKFCVVSRNIPRKRGRMVGHHVS